MFGYLKDNILNQLEKVYISEGEKPFKKEFHNFIKVIKENNSLKEYYEMYDLFNQVNFDDESIAKEFVEESLKHLKSFNSGEVKKLEPFINGKEKKKLAERSINFKLDQLLFNENINIKDKVTHKIDLIKLLVNRENKPTTYNEGFINLQSRINENVGKLNEAQTQILELFVENDSKKINDYYTNLINETTDLVDRKVLATENIEVAKTLLEVKIKLSDLKKLAPNIEEIENIIDLKESFA